MSFSHADVSDQVKDITRIVGMSPGCDVLDHRTTNKRMIIICTGRNIANTLSKCLRINGFPINQAASALKSDLYYVQVNYNYPY